MVQLVRQYNNGPVSVASIAKKEKLSVSYLEQLLNRLKRSGIIRSIRGPCGGYVLAKNPARISVYAVMKVLEGDLALVFCVSDKSIHNKCDRMSECVTKFLWKRLNNCIKDVLESVSLADLCKKAGGQISL